LTQSTSPSASAHPPTPTRARTKSSSTTAPYPSTPPTPSSKAAGTLIKEYPFILGYDTAGEVVEVGANVTKLSVGPRIIAQGSGSLRGKTAAAAYQRFTVVPQLPVCPIPESEIFEQACVLPLALSTAAVGLYPPGFLEFEFPSLTPKRSGKTLLVWGGSSSLGCCAIQLTVASGLDVVTTCSARNFESVQEARGE
jgi:NADPH:quinone reductase-like Zn-dependent oxidoreductase